MTDWKTTTLGKTGWKVGRLGLASSYGADERCVQMAFERGVNYLYWGTMRTAKFGAGLRSLRSRRDEFRLVIQSYSRVAAMVPWSLERALKSLGMDHADILLLGLWNKDVSFCNLRPGIAASGAQSDSGNSCVNPQSPTAHQKLQAQPRR